METATERLSPMILSAFNRDVEQKTAHVGRRGQFDESSRLNGLYDNPLPAADVDSQSRFSIIRSTSRGFQEAPVFPEARPPFRFCRGETFMADNVQEFTDTNFQSDVLDRSEPVLVDFWAPWCGPCKMLTPIIEELADEYEGKVRIGKMNTDENPQTATSHNISAIPTVMLFKDGEVVQKFVGVTPKEKFASALDEHI